MEDLMVKAMEVLDINGLDASEENCLILMEMSNTERVSMEEVVEANPEYFASCQDMYC